MPPSPPRSGDLPVGLVLLLAGATSVAVAASRGATAFHFIPSMDGCLTVGVVGFGLALLAGVPYQRALLLLVPVMAIQLVGTRVHQASPFAIIGIEAVVFGLLGVALGLRAQLPARRSPAGGHAEENLENSRALHAD